MDFSLPAMKKQKNSKSKHTEDISKLSKNMEYIVQQQVIARGLNTGLLKSNEFSHIIIKAVQDDEKMYLVAMTKRLQQCCPFLEHHTETLDIETLGLLDKRPLPEITCACLFDGKQEYMLQFYGVTEDLKEANKQMLIELLDSADRLLGFNIVFFDLEYIKQKFGVSDEKMSYWVRKTVDPFMFLKFVPKQTAKLSSLLAMNDLASKTGSGLQAISLALEGKFEQLLQYCLMDAKLVYNLCHLDVMKFKDADNHTLKLKIDFVSSGKWTVLAEKRKKPAKLQRRALPYPVLSGIVRKNANITQVLQSQSILVNPEALDWIHIE